MSDTTPPTVFRPAPRPRAKALAVAALVAFAGLAAAVVHAAMIDGGYRRFMLAYLVAFAFVLSLSLGALFFVFIQHLTRAGWSVLVRRPAEVLAANMLTVSLLFLPIAVNVAVGGGEIYPWARPDSAAVLHDYVPEPLLAEEAPSHHAADVAHAHEPPIGYAHQQLDALTLRKRPYLNRTFFLVRVAAMLAMWTAMGIYFRRLSLRQDQDGDVRHTRRLERAAGPAALLFGVTVTFGAFDLLMSLNPHWYSTIFGVYYFSGAVVGALALLIVLVVMLRRAGSLAGAVGTEHLLDLGRLLFAFVFFWAYIAFSQYMLLWYANMPDTTIWLHIRGATTAAGGANAWSGILLLLLFGHFLIPFLALMTRHTKRRPALLAACAGWLLLMHYMDLLWVVMPELGPTLALGAIELGLLLALSGVYALGALLLASGHSLVPTRDPRLPESITHEPAY